MNRRRIGALLAAGMMLLAGFATAEDADPVVVRVGDIVFTRSEIQPALQTDINLSQMVTGTYLTEEEREAWRQETIERYIGAGVIQMKLKDAGRNDFTEEEESSLQEAARNQYEQIWQGIWQKARDAEEEFTEEQVTEFMEDSGYTISALLEEYRANERRLRAVELFCPGLLLTEDMVQEYYEEFFLNPDRELYENNIERYEQDIIATKNESFYTPEGYRAIKQILLDYPDEVERGLKNERARCNLDAEKLSAALQTLTMAATTAESWEDMREARAAYDEAAAEMQAALEDYHTKRRKGTAPLIQPVVDAIMEEFEAGIDMDSLIRKYSSDTNEINTTGGGYPFHPESRNWTEEFSAAARALKQPGEISEPVYSDLGVHILYYAGDIPGGGHVLTEQEEQILNASAKQYYEGLELDRLIEDWKTDYEIETHPELLDR